MFLKCEDDLRVIKKKKKSKKSKEEEKISKKDLKK